MSEPTTTDDSFVGVKRLYGEASFDRISRAHVCVIGLGGVGSWAVEALVRSGIGELTLVDADSVCVTNTNRQLQATLSNVGKQKTAALKKRILDISPNCKVHLLDRFLTPSNADDILDEGYTYVIDAIDSMYSKTMLIQRCHARKQALVVCGGAAGRVDPLAIRAGDLTRSVKDPLLKKVRRELRTKFNFPTGKDKVFGFDCVYSTEAIMEPENCEAGSKNCETSYGSCCHVTAQFGFVAASVVINRLSRLDPISLQ